MRLINADAIKLPEGFFEKVDNVPKFYDWLNYLPTIDAVEIVRCEDCKNWDRDWTPERTPEVHYCWMIDLFTDGEFYCKDGERRNTDGK